MRNLQKILALALALIMSFSLVVTANAFDDDDQITENYQDAVTVLAGLEVFKGYTDGTYKPQDSISRAEVAAIIYRITTGDVTDSQRDIYSDWNRFTDVKAGEWWAGYINYCANAEYIQGYGNGKFGPDDEVTGYQALAMILRALGYDKMGEFVGSDWAVNTAARANSLKITKNVTAATLGAPATRELVAELLFRSILQKTVTYNTVTGYVEDNDTLGKQTLNLDEVTGVVVANEFANLEDGEDVLAEGKTKLEVAENDVRTLDYTTDLNDMGMAKFAYIQGGKVLAMTDAGTNTVYDNTTDKGEGVDIDTKKKFKDLTTLSKEDDTEFYENFDYVNVYESDYRIEIEVIFGTKDGSITAAKAEGDFNDYAGVKIADVAAANKYDVTASNDGDNWIDPVKDTTYTYVKYHRVFKAEEQIKSEDLKVIKGIFGYADDEEKVDGIEGSVWAGTTGKTTGDKEEKDLSNNISYKTFKKDYINPESTVVWDSSNDGEWVKIIDNDADGKADYAFKTTFTLDTAVSTYTKSGTDYLEYYSIDITDETELKARYMNEVAQGDIVLHTEIDGQALIWKAETAEDSVKNVSVRDHSLTTTSDVTYLQSEIGNVTRMEDDIVDVDNNVNYRFYLDAFGRIRAYEPVDGIKYALLTEMYYTKSQNDRFVVNSDLTVEMASGSSSVKEYDVSNNSNPFVLNFTDAKDWEDLEGVLKTGVYKATANANGDNRWKQNVLKPAVNDLGRGTTYGEGTTASSVFTKATTNVARVIVDNNGDVRLQSAVRTANESSSSYDVNYIGLKAGVKIEADQALYTIDQQPAEIRKNGGYSNTLRATSSTEFYIVSNGGVTYFTDYKNMPEIAAADVQAAYAVARSSASITQNGGARYWLADVIVIEAPNYATDEDDLLLILGQQEWWEKGETARTTMARETSDNSAQRFLAISKNTGRVISIVPDDYGWKDYTGPGFYRAWGVDATDEDGTYEIDSIAPITITGNADYVLSSGKKVAPANNWRIRAGVVVSFGGTIESDRYLVVDEKDGKNTKIDVYPRGNGTANWGVLYKNRQTYLQTPELNLSDSGQHQIEKGDRIIWVEDKDHNAKFIVDVSYTNEKLYSGWDVPTWLIDYTDDENKNPVANCLWQKIVTEQIAVANGASSSDVTYKDAAAAAKKALESKKLADLEAALAMLLKIDPSKLTDTEKAEYAKYVADLQNEIALQGGATSSNKALALIAEYNNYKTAKATYDASNKTDADKAALQAAANALYKAASEYKKAGLVATDTNADSKAVYAEAQRMAGVELGAFVTALDSAAASSNGATFAKVAAAAKVVPSDDAVEIAVSPATYKTNKAEYDKLKPLYDAAKAVSDAYYNWKQAVLPADKETTKAALTAAVEATKKNSVGTNISSYFSDANSENFGHGAGFDYTTAMGAIPVDAAVILEKKTPSDKVNFDAKTGTLTLLVGNSDTIENMTSTKLFGYLQVKGTTATDTSTDTLVADSPSANQVAFEKVTGTDNQWKVTFSGKNGGNSQDIVVTIVKLTASSNDALKETFTEPEVTKNEDGTEITATTTIGGKDGTEISSNLDGDDTDNAWFDGPIQNTDQLAWVAIDLTKAEYGLPETYGSVKITQVNEALKTAYPGGGGGINGNTKIKSYSGVVEEYLVLVQTGKPITIKVEVDKFNPSFTSADITLVIEIANNVTIVH